MTKLNKWMLDIFEAIILFSRQIELDEAEFLNHFSCPSQYKRGLAGRVVVTYEGPDDGSGHWKCEKDTVPCNHLELCRKKFAQLVEGDPDAKAIDREPENFHPG